MWEDLIVAGVRRVRTELIKECNGDFHEISRRAIVVQKEYEDRLDEGLIRAIEEGVQGGRASREEVFRLLTADEVEP